MAEKRKVTRFKTGRGIAVYPHTNKARRYDESTNRSVFDPEGSYEMEVAFEGNDPQVAKLKAMCLAECKASGFKLKNEPWRMEEDKQSGEETGRVIFKFKQYGKDRDGAILRIPHWNAKGDALLSADPEFRLTGGSTVIVSGRAKAYKGFGGGCSLSMDAIQVIKLVATAAHNPFGDESDGSEDDEADDRGFPEETGSDTHDADEDPTDF